MRSSTSVSQAMGSTPFSLAVWISVMAMAQWRASPSDPTNNAFFRVRVWGLMARSTTFVSISTRPSSMNTTSQVPYGVSKGPRQVGGGGYASEMILQPGKQGLRDRSTSLLSHLLAVFGWMSADLGLDGIQCADARQHLS